MRLIDADELMEEINQEKIDDFWVNKSPNFNYFRNMVKSFKTVDAIPIEQVANFLMKFLDDEHPCNFEWFAEKMIDDEWCAYNCPIGENVKTGNECWLHAIKEGWLDE